MIKEILEIIADIIANTVKQIEESDNEIEKTNITEMAKEQIRAIRENFLAPKFATGGIVKGRLLNNEDIIKAVK